MNKLIGLVLIAILSAASLTMLAQPANEPGGHRHTTGDIEANQRGTTDTPFVIEESPAQSKNESTQHVADITEQKRINGWNISLTLVIAVCAFLQFCGIVGQVIVYLKQTKIMGQTLTAINTQATHMASQLTEMRTANEAGRISSAETLAAIKLQGLSMKRHTTIHRKAAEAALKQVNHLINTERHFMMIEVREGISGSYDFFAVNHGKSPAQLIFINPSPIIIAPEFAEELPKDPWYGMGYYEEGMTVFNQAWIPSGKDCSLGTVDKEVVNMWVEANPGVNTGHKELLVYGAIKYRGRFSEEVWSSKYCYRKLPVGMRMAGPYGWNDYT